MKKVLFSILAFFILFPSWAQTLTIGARAGVNYSNITFSGPRDVFRPAYKIGWHAGLVGLIPIKGRLALKPELLVSRKGYRGEGTNADGFRRLHLNYIDIPLLAEFTFGKIHLDVGPQASFLFRAGRIVTLDGVDRYREENKLHNRMDLGYVLGASFRMNDHSRVGVRYSGGLMPIDREADPGRAYTSARNQLIQLTLTYFLRERFY
jgi:hypothetical protein